MKGRAGSGGPGGAYATSPRQSTVVPVLPNGPAVTGGPNAGFEPPLEVSGNDIFRNGFEAPPLGAVDLPRARAWQMATA